VLFGSTGADAFGNDRAARALADMDHLGSGVGLLAIVGDGDGVKFADAVLTVQQRRTDTST